MAYTDRQRRRIKIGVCIDCGGGGPIMKFRRCEKCRRVKAAARPKQERKLKPAAACHPVTRQQRKRKADRAARRGYWPEIHGAD